MYRSSSFSVGPVNMPNIDACVWEMVILSEWTIIYEIKLNRLLSTFLKVEVRLILIYQQLLLITWNYISLIYNDVKITKRNQYFIVLDLLAIDDRAGYKKSLFPHIFQLFEKLTNNISTKLLRCLEEIISNTMNPKKLIGIGETEEPWPI